MALILVLACVFQVSATGIQGNTQNIDALLAPYQEIIDKVNNDIGSSYTIPRDYAEQVYNYYKDMSLDEFEETLISEYNEFISDRSTVQNADVNDEEKKY